MTAVDLGLVIVPPVSDECATDQDQDCTWKDCAHICHENQAWAPLATWRDLPNEADIAEAGETGE